MKACLEGETEWPAGYSLLEYCISVKKLCRGNLQICIFTRGVLARIYLILLVIPFFCSFSFTFFFKFSVAKRVLISWFHNSGKKENVGNDVYHVSIQLVQQLSTHNNFRGVRVPCYALFRQSFSKKPYTTQVNSAFRALCLVSSKVISKYYRRERF